MGDAKAIKLVVVGDGGVGKTCLLFAYVKKEFVSKYIPTILDTTTSNVMVDGHPMKLNLFDTAGQEDYDRLRPLAYVDTDIFLLCFSVVNPKSLENITEKWIPEINHHRPNTPYLLVGTKTDLKDDQEIVNKLAKTQKAPVSMREGISVAKKIKAVQYFECSAKTLQGVENVFDEAVKAALKPADEGKKIWCNLF